MGLPTIGFTVPWGTDNSYVGPIWQGVIEACRERGANLLSFTGPRQLSDVFLMFPQYGFQMNSSNVDAMIVVCASAALVRNMAGYGEFPVITISDPNGECPSLVSDNEAGIGATIDHLVLDHGYRRIAFIRGPAHDSAAAARYGSYREALARHGIPFDEDLVFPGSYDRASGREAARLLLERGTECRAIVASNDLCALGAISALAEAGVGVPEDIAVTGFDDSDEAAFCIPPLASVRQPQRGMGRRAVEMALARLRGEAVPMVEALPTEFVPRRSCGCFSAQVRGAARPGAAAQARQAGEAAEAIRELLALPDAGLEPLWAEGLVESFETGIAGCVSAPFLDAIDRISRGLFQRGLPVGALQGALSALNGWGGAKAEERARAEGLLQEARVLIGEAAACQQAQRRALLEAESVELRRIGESLITTFRIEALCDLVALEWPLLGIGSCYIALYEAAGAEAREPQAKARLALALRDGQRMPLPREGLSFPARELLPPGFLPERFQLVVMPLSFLDESLGFALFEIKDGEGGRAAYELLRGQLSSALKGALLVRGVEERAEELLRANRELDGAYTSLRDNQERLLISEKMASLGRLTAGIAHEMNTPLATVRSAIMELEGLVGEYRDSIGNPQVLPGDYREIADDMLKYLSLADKAAERSAYFIRGIKSQTYDRSKTVQQAFNVAPIVEETLNLLGFALRKGQIELETELDESLRLMGEPRHVSQILTNLVMNSIEACAPNPGRLSVRLFAPSDAALVLEVEDSGCGIPPENLPKIFDQLFTTKPFGEGTGLGLSIVHDLVGEFGGSIKVESRPGKTVFSLGIPRLRA